MRKRWYILALLLSLLTGFAFGQESWNLGSSEDWLSIGPVYHIGPYYYPNSDLSIGLQRFLGNYPSYPQIYYPSYYPTYRAYYSPTYFPYYYPYNYYFDSFPMGTFGLKAGGSLY
jgi:hypothetical protein